MKKTKAKLIKSSRRARRVRAKVRGNAAVPRLSVFRSSKYIYAQLIDDVNANTLLSADSRDLESSKKGVKRSEGSASRRQEELAFSVGRELGEQALKKGITRVRFDRGAYQYHGRVAKVAEGAREAGLKL